LGLNPEQALSREFMTQGAITEKTGVEEFQLGFLRGKIKQLLKEEIR
jgi:hypothetical protein